MTREEAKKYVIRHCNPSYPKASKTQWDLAINMAIDALSQPEIIYCKDCVHNKAGAEAGNANCELYYDMTYQMGYCHRGERREHLLRFL